MTRPRKPTRVTAITAALLVAIVTAACSDGSSTHSTTAAKATGATSTGDSKTAQSVRPADATAIELGNIAPDIIAIRDALTKATDDGWHPEAIDTTTLDGLAGKLAGHEGVPLYWLLRDVILGARLSLELNGPGYARAALHAVKGVEHATGIELEIANRRRAKGEPFRPSALASGDDLPIPTGPVVLGPPSPPDPHEHAGEDGDAHDH